MPPIITTTHVSKIYQNGKEKIYALNNVSLQIEQGEFVSVLGVSGSGKSTFMNVIAGFDRPDKGDVVVAGQRIFSLSDRAISRYRNCTIGFVFQSFNLNASLTALENVMLPLVYAKAGRTERRELAQEALEKVGLAQRLNFYPHQLSGGQRQRVSIARAICNSPQIILADEPTGNLDQKSGDKVMRILSELNKKGYTVIMVTHNRVQAQICSRIIEIEDGRVVTNEKNS